MKTLAELHNRRLLEVLKTIRFKITRVAGDRVKIFLYGSYVRGEEREDSDVDLMIVLPDDAADLKTKDKIRDLIYDFDEFFFSVLIVTESQMKQYDGFKVFGSVEREGMPV